MDNMTDMQLQVIVELILNVFEHCKDVDEVKQKIVELREMVQGT